jgi:hypothetical protein
VQNYKQSLFENISILVGTVAILIITPLTGHAEVSFLGVAAGDASSHDATVWTRAKDEANLQPTAVDVQISTVLEVSPDGKTLAVTSYGINSTVQNGFEEYDPVNNPEELLFSFKIHSCPTPGEKNGWE